MPGLRAEVMRLRRLGVSVATLVPSVTATNVVWEMTEHSAEIARVLDVPVAEVKRHLGVRPESAPEEGGRTQRQVDELLAESSRSRGGGLRAALGVVQAPENGVR